MSRSLYSMLLSSDLKTNTKERKQPKGKKPTKNWLKVAVGINDRPLIKKMFISNFTFNI